jgi:hypothetical protein
VTVLTQPTAASGCAALTAALCGAAVALMPRRAPAGSGASGVLTRAITAAGLLLAASGFGALYLAGTASVPGRMLTLLCVPLAGGLGAALTSSLRETGVAGVMAGVVILLAGVVAGYLAAGSMQLHALAGAPAVQAVHGDLATAAGRWALVAAAATALVGLALAGPRLR